MQTNGGGPGAHLTQEQQATQALLAVLRQEQDRLIDADAEGLAALLEEKLRLVAGVTQLTLARHRALAAAGFDASETGMRAWVGKPAASVEAAQAWARLLELAREAKEINRTNGMLINKQLARNQSALSILQGESQNGDFYGPNGQAASRTVSRSRVIG